MKKAVLTMAFLFATLSVFAQWQVPLDGIYDLAIFEYNAYDSKNEKWVSADGLVKIGIDLEANLFLCAFDMDYSGVIEDEEVKAFGGHWMNCDRGNYFYAENSTTYFSTWFDTGDNNYYFSFSDKISGDFWTMTMRFTGEWSD